MCIGIRARRGKKDSSEDCLIRFFCIRTKDFPSEERDHLTLPQPHERLLFFEHLRK